MSSEPPFWKTTPLDQMTREQWEALCDGCGRCCLHKLRDEDTDAVSHTNVACRLLDTETCRCTHYAIRQQRVPDCVSLTPADLDTIDWLPPSCAYRLLAEGRELRWWHPLVSGDPATVVHSGASVRGRAVSERRAGPLEHHVVDWPGRMPRGGRPRAGPAPRPGGKAREEG